MSWTAYLIFVVTTAIVCLSPGPAALLAVAHGWRRAHWAIAGIALANTLYFALSALGIAALVATNGTLFAIVKWAGVAYLFYLGLTALLARASALTVARDPARTVGGRRALLQAFVMEATNPKALLYFVALLPQFVAPARPLAPQMLLFGASTVLLDLASYGAYAWLGSQAGRFTAHAGFVKASNCIAGGLLMTAGLLMMTVKQAA